MDFTKLKMLSYNASRSKTTKDPSNYLLLGILVLSLITVGLLVFKMMSMKKKEKYENVGRMIGGNKGLPPTCQTAMDALNNSQLSSTESDAIYNWIAKNCQKN